MKWDFEGDEPNQTAQGFSNKVGRWEVVNDGGNHVLTQSAENRDSVFNVTLIEKMSCKNVDLSIRIKAVAGENESGGGVIWRAKDQDNYYVARYNPYSARHAWRKPNFRVYKVEHGKLTQLDHANAPGEVPDQAGWHALRITMHGSEIVGYLDGKKLLEADDATFLDVGKIGLWSRSDARPYFDDLTVAPYRPSEERE